LISAISGIQTEEVTVLPQQLGTGPLTETLTAGAEICCTNTYDFNASPCFRLNEIQRRNTHRELLETLQDAMGLGRRTKEATIQAAILFVRTMKAIGYTTELASTSHASLIVSHEPSQTRFQALNFDGDTAPQPCEAGASALLTHLHQNAPESLTYPAATTSIHETPAFRHEFNHHLSTSSPPQIPSHAVVNLSEADRTDKTGGDPFKAAKHLCAEPSVMPHMIGASNTQPARNLKQLPDDYAININLRPSKHARVNDHVVKPTQQAPVSVPYPTIHLPFDGVDVHVENTRVMALPVNDPVNYNPMLSYHQQGQLTPPLFVHHVQPQLPQVYPHVTYPQHHGHTYDQYHYNIACDPNASHPGTAAPFFQAPHNMSPAHYLQNSAETALVLTSSSMPPPYSQEFPQPTNVGHIPITPQL
jgi:hypothetical protein